MKKFLFLLAMMTITSSIFSQTTKFWKITKNDGTKQCIKLSSIADEQIVDSVYSPLLDSLYNCIQSGPWYTIQTERKLPTDTVWTAWGSPPTDTYDFDLYTKNYTKSWNSYGKIYYESPYVINSDGKSFTQSNAVVTIVKLTMNEFQIYMPIQSYIYHFTQRHTLN